MSFEMQARSLLSAVRGAPLDIIMEEVLAASRDFFQQSSSWVEALDPVRVLPGVTRVFLGLPPGSELATLMRVALSGNDLNIGKDCWIALDDPESLDLKNGVSHESSLVAVVALKPDLRSGGLTMELEGAHGRAIRFGALANLKAMSGTEWHDPGGAEYYYNKFRGEIAAGRRRQIRKKHGQNLTVRPARFF